MTAKEALKGIDSTLYDLEMCEDMTPEIQNSIDEIYGIIDRYHQSSDWSQAIETMDIELEIKHYPKMEKILDMVHKNHPEFLV